jgi:hypothetical protein
MDYDRRGDGVPTNLFSDFNGEAAADDKPVRRKKWTGAETRGNVLCRPGFAESFDQSYSLRLAFFVWSSAFTRRLKNRRLKAKLRTHADETYDHEIRRHVR